MLRHIYLLAILLLTVPALAQTQEPCATMEEDARSRKRFPQRGTLTEFEDAVGQQVRLLQQQRANGRTQATVITIPVIVHVVHNGESVGTGMNISEAQVKAQLAVLNEDFRRKVGTPGYNTNPVGADIEIEFCLSPYDEKGNLLTEPGIHRYNGSRADWSRDQIENILKPSTIWNPNQYYNIWTVKFAASDANLLGYAQFPDQSGLAGISDGGPASTDGVVIRYNSFGSVDKGTFPVMQAPYNKGRTLTHETGHWLGLRHIWGDGACADDFVADTPPAASASSGCPIGRISCGNTNMVENYMDYSNDACMNIFTEGQKTRMRAVMDISPRRKALLSGNLCAPNVTAVPDANFSIDKQKCVLLGSEINFVDLSTNFPTAWQWTFEGGDPATSTARNPKITYNTPGSYKVTLVATNKIGDSAPRVIEDYIVVTEAGLCNDFNNFTGSHTPSVVPLSAVTTGTGYLAGNNSLGSQAFAEFFVNECGYQYISGATVRFGFLSLSDPTATVSLVVWNALGPGGAPGAVIERKTVLLQQVLNDMAAARPTSITFDRETPTFRRAFYVGIEIAYSAGYTIALTSSANGQANKATSWIKDQNGQWQLYTTSLGANIALDIKALVGMKPSVQVSASKLLILPGEEVILNGRGASIFVWDTDDGTVTNFPGPQLIITPREQVTVTTTGSGLDLCNNKAYTTIYVRSDVTSVNDEVYPVSLYPNPGSSVLSVTGVPANTGFSIRLKTLLGQEVPVTLVGAQEDGWQINTAALPPGLYLVEIVHPDKKTITQKWIKQ